MTYLGRWWGFELHDGNTALRLRLAEAQGLRKKMYDVWTRWGWVIFEELEEILIEEK